LAAVGAVGAAAGLAWRWAQRRRGAGVAQHRDLSRWEGEGGALASVGESAPQNGATAPSASAPSGAPAASNGAIAGAWPFPHGTRH
jgi:hypothetical protein